MFVPPGPGSCGGCALLRGGGGKVRAAEGILDVQVATESDWRALECARVNQGEMTVRLLRTTRGDTRCNTLIREINPHVIICNVAKGSDIEWIRQTLQQLVSSKASVLILQCSNQLLTSEL